tara:strand:- start:59 stop:520 length:462 start_codon:yes stop_codon:yes gene_type:complete
VAKDLQPTFLKRFEIAAFEDIADYEASDLDEAIIENISDVLNTRCMLSKEEYKLLKVDTRTIAHPNLYGLPDFTYYDAANKWSWTHLKRYIKNAIRLFEPRFTVSDIKVLKFEESSQVLEVVIEGQIVALKDGRTIAFKAPIGNMAKKLKLNA